MSILVKGMKMPTECRECPLCQYHEHTGHTWCEAMDGLLAEDYRPIAFDGRHPDCPLEEADDGWISVEDRLPEEDGTLGGYLASIGNWVGILCFVEGKFMEWTLANGLKEPEFPVTAWMPLPKPYQTKEKKHDND